MIDTRRDQVRCRYNDEIFLQVIDDTYVWKVSNYNEP